MSSLLRLLMVEDSENDAFFLLHTLKKAGYEVVSERVDTPEAMREALQNRPWDIITSDHAMPHFSAPDALKMARDLRPDLPLVIVSGEIDLNLAVSLMKSGAEDYIQKNELARLPSAIERTLRDSATRRAHQAIEEELHHQQALLSQIASISPVGIILLDASGEITYANAEAENVLGLSTDNGLQRKYGVSEWKITDFEGNPFPPEQLPLARVMSSGESVRDVHHAIEWPNGLRLYLSINATPIFSGSQQPVSVAATIFDISESVYTEKALRADHAFRTAIIENAAQGLFVCHAIPEPPYMHFTVWNERMTAITGYSIAEINKHGWHLSIGGDKAVQKKAMARLNDVLAGRGVIRQEYEITCPGGEKKTIDISTSRLEGSDGNRHLLGLISDVTERKQAEAAIRASEQKFRAMFDNASDAIFILDFEGHILEVNRVACERLDYSREELLGKTPADINDAYQADRIQTRIEKTISSGSMVFETTHLSKTGRLIPTEVNSRVIDYCGKPAILAIARDITERKRAEEELDYERRLLRTVVDNVPDQIFVRDRACRFILNNVSDARVMGIDDPKTLVGKSDDDFYPPELAKKYQADDIRVMELRQPLINHEEYTLSPDGSKRWVLTTKVPLYDNHEQVIGIVGIARDITDRKLAEEHTDRLGASIEQRLGECFQKIDIARSGLQNLISSLPIDDSNHLPQDTLNKLNEMRTQMLKVKDTLDEFRKKA